MTDSTPAEAATDADLALFELFMTDEGHRDPRALYARLHEVAPVHWSGTGDLFLSRYDDCRALLRDNRFGKAGGPSGAVPGTEGADPRLAELRATAFADRPASMLFLNPPDHTRIRGLVSRAFTPRRVHALRPRIEAFATECLDRMADLGEFDLLEELGFPLPVAVIGELVGVPRADWGRFRRLVSTGALLLENAITYEQACEAVAANDEMWAYFVDLVDRTRRHPGDDLLSAMLEVADADGDRLTTDELIVSAILMFAAGFETTTNLIGNGVAALCRHPDQLARLRRDPALVPAAVEEILRWDSPVQLDGRSALVDADIAGQAVKAGQRVVTILGAANHDPTHFTDPGRFDVTRDEGPPLSFGSGIHHCLGANLARAEGQVVLAGLLERFDRIEVTAPLVNRQRLTLRGYESVPVRVA